MPEQVTRLRVFVASPSDVADERDRLAREIERLNRTLGQDAKVVLELVRWETHTWPGFGEDAQAVINEQIAPYDIFVGIMWRRLGSRTGRSPSGTVEEFERAYELWKTHRRPHIMFYFNRAPFEPSNEEARSQADAVRAFKNVVSRRGGLWHEYDGAQHFADLVHEHLYSEVRQLLQEPRSSASDGSAAGTSHARLRGDEAPRAAAPKVSPERKLVTVLCLELDGSTALPSEHDAEVVRGAIDRAFGIVDPILARHGGTVERYVGDAVVAVFGIPAVHDDDADRAVRAAIEIREAIASLPASSGGALSVRIGISSGDAIAGGSAAKQVLVAGEPVVTSARLQQAAAPGEILVGGLTRQLTERSVTYGPVQRATSGLAGMEAWPALGVTTALPEEHRGVPGLRAPLIGREKEMRFLHDAYARLANDERAYMVTVFGSPGSGKTRLADDFVSSLAGVRVLRGRCLPYGEGITYYPLMVLIRADAGILPADSRDEAVNKLRGSAVEAFGHDPDADSVFRRVSVVAGLARPNEVIPVAAANLAEELRWGVRRYFERRAHDAPIVLVFEDIHWAEPTLLDAIEYMIESSRARLFILCLARPDLRELRPTWGGGATNAAAIELPPLSAENTQVLVSELLSVDALPEAVRSDIVRRAEGNPLYVEEFLRMLIDQGRIEQQRDGKWRTFGDALELEIPPTLQGLITARLDRVSGDVKQLLQRASIPSRLVSTAALAALSEGRPPTPQSLREAIRRDLLIELDEPTEGGGRVFRFKHALIRDVAYSTIPKGKRSHLHDVYGRWREAALGERSAEVIETLAYHAEQAYLVAKELGLQKVEDLGQRAFAYLRTAAAGADRREDAHAARSLFRRAAAVGAGINIPQGDAVEVQASIALQESRSESTAESRTALLRAIEAVGKRGPSELLIHLLAQAALDGGLAQGERQRHAAHASTAARLLDDPELVAEAAFVVGFSATTFEEAYSVFKESYAAQVSSGAQRTLPKTLAILGVDAAKLGRFSEGFHYREEALRLARLSGSRVLLAEALYRLGVGEQHVGDLSRAHNLAQELVAVAADLGVALYEMQAGLLMGMILDDLGDEALARRRLQEVFDRARAGDVPFLSIAAACRLVRSYLREGNIDHAEEYIPVKFENPGPNRGLVVPMGLGARAEIHAARGNDARAEILFAEALALLDALRDGATQAETRRIYARFLIERNRGPEARAHVEWLLSYYAEPIAERQRLIAEDLMRQIEASPA